MRAKLNGSYDKQDDLRHERDALRDENVRLRAIETTARAFWVMSRGTALEPEWMEKFRALGIALGEL